MEPQRLTRSSGSVVVDVVETVARATGADPLSLEPQLCEAVDPDALERLVDSPAVSEITFDYGGHTVVVTGDGTVIVERARDDGEQRGVR